MVIKQTFNLYCDKFNVALNQSDDHAETRTTELRWCSFLTSAVFSTLLKKLERKFKIKLAFVPFIVPYYKNVHRYISREKYISKINIIGIT